MFDEPLMKVKALCESGLSNHLSTATLLPWLRAQIPKIPENFAKL